MARFPWHRGITIYVLLPLAFLLFLGDFLGITVKAEAPAIARAASRRCEVTVDGEVFHPLGIQIEQDWLDDGVAGTGPNGGSLSPRATPGDDVTDPTWSAGFSALMTEAEAWRYMDSFCAGRRIQGQEQGRPGQGSGQSDGGQGSRGEQGPGWGSCAEQLMVHCSDSYLRTAPNHPKGSLVLFPPDRQDPRPADLMSRLASLRQVVTLAEYTDLLGEVSSGGIARSAAGGKETKEHGTDGASSSSRAGLAEEGPPSGTPSSSAAFSQFGANSRISAAPRVDVRRIVGAYAGNEGGSSATISSAGSGGTLDTPTTMEHVVVLPMTSWSTRDRLPALWNMSLSEFPQHNIAWARNYEPARNGHEANPLLWHGRRPDGDDSREGTAWDRAQSLWMDTIHNRIHKYLRRTSPEEVRWFLVTDDDMWINVPSLLRFINRPWAGGGHGGSVGINSRGVSGDGPHRPLEHHLPVAFGHGWPWYRWDETSDYLSGGILLSREAMVRLSQHLYTGVCPRPPSWKPRRSMSEEGEDGSGGRHHLVEEKTKPCDVFLSECLWKIGVALIASPFHHAIPPHLKGYPGGERLVIQKAYLKKEQSRDKEPNELRKRVATISPFEYESAIVVNGFVGNKALEILAKRVQLRRRLLRQALSSDERGGLDAEGNAAWLSRWWYGGAAPPLEFV